MAGERSEIIVKLSWLLGNNFGLVSRVWAKSGPPFVVNAPRSNGISLNGSLLLIAIVLPIIMIYESYPLIMGLFGIELCCSSSKPPRICNNCKYRVTY